MCQKTLHFKVDTSATLIRIGVLSAAFILWFVSRSLNTFSYIVTHGHPYGGENLYNWVWTFTNDYLIFLVMIACYLLAERNIERRFDFLRLPSKYDYVENIILEACGSLELEEPLEVRFLDLEEPYSFTYGRRSKGAKLVLSKGLIEILDKEELKFVVLHELSHIKNKDLVFMTWGVALLNALKYWLSVNFLLLLVGVIQHYLKGKLGEYVGFYIHITLPTVIIMIITFMILPLLVINSVSRVREFLADTYACKFVEEVCLKSSLTKISRALVLLGLRRSLVPSHLAIMSFTPPSRFPSGILRNTVATHPSIKERIEAVMERKYIISWKNACKVDRKSVYAGIIAFIIGLVNFMIVSMTESYVGKVETDFSIFLTVVIPLFFIFWANGHNFLYLLDHVPFNVSGKILSLLKTIAKNLISTSILVGLFISVLWVSSSPELTALFWFCFLFFLIFAGLAFLYTVGISLCIIFQFLWSCIKRE